jgi:hypothetical protein
LPTDRAQLAIVVGGADHEEIGDHGQVVDVEDHDVLGLGLRGRLCDNPGERRRFDNC